MGNNLLILFCSCAAGLVLGCAYWKGRMRGYEEAADLYAGLLQDSNKLLDQLFEIIGKMRMKGFSANDDQTR